METLSQRELRNNSAAVIRGLERGMSYRITNRGVPVGLLTPISESVFGEQIVRDGTQNMDFTPGARNAESTQDALRESRDAG